MKETASLIDLQLVDEVIIIGKGEDNLLKYQVIDEKRKIVRVQLLPQRASYGSITRKVVGLIRIIQYMSSALWIIIKKRPVYISCHNLMLLPLASIAKWFSDAKLIYVPHELETEKTGLKGIYKKLAKRNERLFIRFADKIMVVCEPIADWYKKEYSIKNIYVLPNVPYNNYVNKDFSKTNYFRNEFNIPHDHLIFIYQGVIDSARGSIELINNFKKINPDKHLIMMGYGDTVPFLKEIAEITPNIHFKQAVPVNEIINYTSSADVGIFYLPFDISLSYRYSLPNKFYEYLIGGLPIVVSENLEYLSKKISDSMLGWVLSCDQKEFIEFINSIDKNHIAHRQSNILPYALRCGWQFEDNILKEVYC